ncbi:hypothetical protein DCAR_0831925 [Daucus carota subsp. sativus]|uniref:TF-B3 domain-containing protein n=1 Tax=Daucus carota subsp. sativus TaxID=79200 RepID=A0A175YN18_DAUCS|nr:hypothetical protein DCAR_0831925 [Daucus carota subsp. sativus]
MASADAANQAAKRKRYEDMKNNVVDEIYNLVIASDAFVTEVETATEELSSLFQNMEKRQSELIKQAVLINKRYGSIADLVEEKKRPKIGETSSSFETLPMSYCKSTRRFLDDSESSLERHNEKTAKEVDNLIKKFNEGVNMWNKRSIECSGIVADKFLILLNRKDTSSNTLDPPEGFIDCCGKSLPDRIIFVLRNGKKIVGSYNSQSCRLSGLRKMFDILGTHSMSSLQFFLFTYDGCEMIFISAFDHEKNEILFPGTPLCMDANGSYPLLSNYFQITVENKHLRDDCFAVEISNEFKDLFEDWHNFQYINIYSGTCCWRLLIRKRDDHHCATIEDGWKMLCDGLELSVGNICIFECPALSYDQFRIRVLEGDEDI